MRISDLDRRHPGVTDVIAASYEQAASVCLSQHHNPPIECEIERRGELLPGRLNWDPPTDRARSAWANVDDATRDGAYAVALAAVEAASGLVAIRRAETRTGADYYVVLQDSDQDDFENAYRLEISGVNGGAKQAVRQRLSQKIEQARKGDSDLPALATVVGFKSALICIAFVEDETAASRSE